MACSSSTQNTPVLKVQILMVDDDSTSLSIVSALLKKSSSKDDDSTSLSIVSALLKKSSSKENDRLDLAVVTVKNPFDALSTLRLQQGAFDLVVTDLHMPEMNGMELRKQVDEEFKLPVIIMSADDCENVILRTLEGGAAFYIVKPVNQDDLKNVWQYALATKTGGKKTLTIKEIRENNQESSSSTLADQRTSLEEVNSATSVNEEKCSKKDGKKNPRNGKRGREDQGEGGNKKAKVIWTNNLHNRFLQAINHIGLDKAVPKKILEFMSMPGLSRENIASHLQKYRIFLKKVAERGAVSSCKDLSRRALRSTFAPTQSSLIFRNIQQNNLSFLRQQPPLGRGSFHPGFGGNATISALGAASGFGPMRFPNQEASSSSSCSFVPQSPYGHPSFQQLTFGYPQANPNRPRLEYSNSNDSSATNLSSNGSNVLSYPANAANGLITNGTSSIQMYQPHQQARSNLQNFSTASSSQNYSGIQAANSGGISVVGNVGGTTINTCYPPLNANNNYAGMRVTTDGQIIGAGQIQLSSGFSNGGNSAGLMNWSTRKGNMNVAPAEATGFDIRSYSLVTRGASSSVVLESANRFPSAPFAAINQGSTSTPMLMPPPQTNIGNGGEGDHYVFGSMNNNPPIFGANSNLQQQQEFGQGELNVGDMLGESSNNPIPYQPHDVDPLHEFLNPDFFNAALQIDDDNSSRNEHPSGRVQNGERAFNPNFGGNANSMDGYLPKFDQQQDNVHRVEPELNGYFPTDKEQEGNQVWDDNLLESLFGNDPFFKE